MNALAHKASPPSDLRLSLLADWVAEILPGERPSIRPVAADASFRRYFRVEQGGRSWIAMDAPPKHEDAATFRRLAEGLRALGLHAPAVVTGDEAQGLLLLEDMGDTTFSRALAATPGQEEDLYRRAVTTLVALQQRWTAAALPLADYDGERLLAEVALLVDWYYPEVAGVPCPDSARRAWFEAWETVLARAGALPATMVLRDYHVDNLMVLPDSDACGLLDFQDALAGSPAYDLVSLLRDARRDVPSRLEQALLSDFANARPELDAEALNRAYWILGAQRNAKILGIFTRLARRDGKPAYLGHMARVWRLLEEELCHPELAPVAAWFSAELPPERRRTPVIGGAPA